MDLVAKEMLSHPEDISGSHGEDHVPGLCIGEKVGLDGIEGGEVGAGTAKFLNLPLQDLGGNPQVIVFPGGVDVRKDHLISLRESLGKLMKQGLGPRVGVGLEDAPELFMGHGGGGG